MLFSVQAVSDHIVSGSDDVRVRYNYLGSANGNPVWITNA